MHEIFIALFLQASYSQYLIDYVQEDTEYLRCMWLQVVGKQELTWLDPEFRKKAAKYFTEMIRDMEAAREIPWWQRNAAGWMNRNA